MPIRVARWICFLLLPFRWLSAISEEARVQKWQNLFSSLLLVGVVYAFYSSVPYFEPSLSNHYQIYAFKTTALQFFQISCLVYSVILMVFYLTEKETGVAKSIYFWRAVLTFLRSPVAVLRHGFSPLERLGLLTCLVKAFFAPLMIVWLLGHSFSMIDNGLHVFDGFAYGSRDFCEIFNTHGFWFLLQFILFFDVFFYTIGYVIELPSLKNQIRSVDPTWLGWFVALMCYPPFNYVSNSILGWQSSDFPQFEDPFIHISMNVLLLSLMAVYASASVALNFKASNLTHRGIVSTGPYRFIRHPAYVCKNLAWWIGSIPALTAALQISIWKGVLVVASVAAWSCVYFLRAITEEDHLRSVDSEYSLYCQKVRFRFVPGVV